MIFDKVGRNILFHTLLVVCCVRVFILKSQEKLGRVCIRGWGLITGILRYEKIEYVLVKAHNSRDHCSVLVVELQGSKTH